jgi:HemY protein
MIRFLILLAALFAIAFGFQIIAGTAGEVTLTLGDAAYAVDVTTALIALIALVAAALIAFLLVRAILRAPHRMARGMRRRNAERGREALSQGLIAVASGDLRTAERAAEEAARRLPGAPLTLLLRAQAAQLKGDRPAARDAFAAMLQERTTRVAGLRGLYIEAEREGNQDAARRIAETAREASPGTPWAARALLRHQTAAGDWEGALRTIGAVSDNRLADKRTVRRQRAVVLAAAALAAEDGEPERARTAAVEAHDLAPDLVPAAVVAGRLFSRLGDIRRATRILEATWKESPHPEIAEAYVSVRPGDAAVDRLQRAETLLKLRPREDEGRLAVARAAIDAREFARVREVLAPILTTRPTRRSLILMAALEEAESGDRGRAREWLARAVHAARDPVWTADGVILEQWAPASPVTGHLDAVEWKVPVAELEGPHILIEESALLPPPPEAPLPPPRPAVEEPPAEASAAPSPGPGTRPAPAGAVAPGTPAGRRDAPPVPDAAPSTAQDRLGRPATDNGSENADAPQIMRPPDDPGVGESDEDNRRFAV